MNEYGAFAAGAVWAFVVVWIHKILKERSKSIEDAERCAENRLVDIEQKLKWTDDCLFGYQDTTGRRHEDGYLKRINDQLAALNAKVFPPKRRAEDKKK